MASKPRPTLSLRLSRSPVITLKPDPFGLGFEVTVTPTQAVGHDREFARLHDAQTYGLHLQKTMGWRLLDLSEAGD